MLFVALDDKEKEFIKFATDFPFVSICDFKKWNSPIAQDYYVFATPTMFLLDNTRKIILRPTKYRK